MSGLVDHTASPATGAEAASPVSDTAASPTSETAASPASEPAAPPAAAPGARPGPPEPPRGLRARARSRRRMRYLRQLRELQLRDLGGFLVEQLRFGRENPTVVQTKLEEAARTDRELRELERALGERQGLRELREPGVGGACASCGTVHGSSDRFCSWCGRKL